MRRLPGAAVALMVVMPGIALAQPPRPIVELGVQGSSRTGDERHVSWSPRLTVPLKRGTAIEATADILKSFEFGGGRYRRSAREFGVHWRQTVFESGRLQIFGVLGGGSARVETDVPEIVTQYPDGRVSVEPAHTSVSSGFVAHLGPAVQVELARWFALRADLRGTIGQRDSGLRGMVGAVIQLPRVRADDQPGAPAAATAIPNAKPKAAESTPPPAAWQRVKPGREVWVTTNTGSLVHGKITAMSDSSLNIREQDREVTIRLDEVRLVEGRDSKKNGFLIGGASGGLAGGVFFAWLGSYLCESDPCEVGGAFVLGALGGAAIGGLLGMMVDGLIPGRQTLFGGSTTVVTPVITPTKKAVTVTVRWH